MHFWPILFFALLFVFVKVSALSSHFHLLGITF